MALKIATDTNIFHFSLNCCCRDKIESDIKAFTIVMVVVFVDDPDFGNGFWSNVT